MCGHLSHRRSEAAEVNFIGQKTGSISFGIDPVFCFPGEIWSAFHVTAQKSGNGLSQFIFYFAAFQIIIPVCE